MVDLTRRGWWLDSFKTPLAVILAFCEFGCGIGTALSISVPSSTPLCIISGVLFMVSALIVLAIEAPGCLCCFECQLPPCAEFFSRRIWIKIVLYSTLAVIPLLPRCIGVYSIFGFLFGLAIAGMFAVAALGKKDSDGTYPMVESEQTGRISTIA